MRIIFLNMADDIDDLLDEVESKFTVEKKNERKVPVQKTQGSRKKPEDDDINKLIDDICGDTEPLEKCNIVSSNSTSGTAAKSRPSSTKCFPVFLGGSTIAKGYGSSFNKRCCDSLRCTSCDFKVVSFDDFEWDKSTDYLFLRNHAPDFHRLQPNLNRRKGYRAYCCQCSSLSVKDIEEVKGLQVKWVCGKH